MSGPPLLLLQLLRAAELSLCAQCRVSQAAVRMRPQASFQRCAHSAMPCTNLLKRPADRLACCCLQAWDVAAGCAFLAFDGTQVCPRSQQHAA